MEGDAQCAVRRCSERAPPNGRRLRDADVPELDGDRELRADDVVLRQLEVRAVYGLEMRIERHHALRHLRAYDGEQ